MMFCIRHVSENRKLAVNFAWSYTQSIMSTNTYLQGKSMIGKGLGYKTFIFPTKQYYTHSIKIGMHIGLPNLGCLWIKSQ